MVATIGDIWKTPWEGLKSFLRIASHEVSVDSIVQVDLMSCLFSACENYLVVVEVANVEIHRTLLRTTIVNRASTLKWNARPVCSRKNLCVMRPGKAHE